jgi:hypothetical protein
MIYKFFRKTCYWIFCVTVFIPFALILFLLGGTDAILGTILHEKFTDSVGGILDRIRYD